MDLSMHNRCGARAQNVQQPPQAGNAAGNGNDNPFMPPNLGLVPPVMGSYAAILQEQIRAYQAHLAAQSLQTQWLQGAAASRRNQQEQESDSLPEAESVVGTPAPEPSASPPQREEIQLENIDIADPDSLKWEKEANKYRLRALFEIGQEFNRVKNTIQRTGAPQEVAEAWNRAAAKIISEAEDIRIADGLKYGYSTIDQMKKEPLSKDKKKLQLVAAAEKALETKASENRKRLPPKKTGGATRQSAPQIPQLLNTNPVTPAPWWGMYSLPPPPVSHRYNPYQINRKGPCEWCNKRGHDETDCWRKQGGLPRVTDTSSKCDLNHIFLGNKCQDSEVIENWLVNQWGNLESFSVKDSLKKHVKAWEEVTDSPLLLGVIREGYKPQFSNPPGKSQKKNNKSARENEEFVLKSVGELLKNGCAKIVEKPPTVVNPLSVSVQANGKKRLICDLRHVNSFLTPPRFKLDDIPTALPAFKKHHFMFSFDFQKGYYHVNLHPDVWEYFGFSFSCNGKTFYAVYTVGPFGLSTMPWLFTKLLKPWVKRWRSLGLHIFLYLDDGLAITPTREEGLYFSNIVRSDLKRAGIHEQTQKCNWDPVSTLTWLGFIIDLRKFYIDIPREKVDRALGAIEDALSGGYCTPRKIMQASGRLNALALVLGKIVYLKTKPLYKEVLNYIEQKQRYSWDRQFIMSQQARECLAFWQKNILLLSGPRSLEITDSESIVYSDASATGGAAFIAEKRAGNSSEPPLSEEDLSENINPNQVALCTWSETERTLSSTWRELKAIEFGLKALSKHLAKTKVRWYTDNLGGTHVVRKGSMKEGLNLIADHINEICIEKDIELEVKWVRRSFNKMADTLSRFVDLDDWGVSLELFKSIDKMWGPFTIDRFANEKNAKLQRFNSRFWTPNSEAVDAFAQKWSKDNNWVVPPPHLIPEVVSLMQSQRAKGTIVAPLWKSARFWPFFFGPQGRREFIQDFFTIPNARKNLIAGEQPNSVFSPETFKGALIALKIDAGK